MLCHVALVRTDVSEEHSASIIRVTRIGGLGTIVFLRSTRRLLVTANSVPSSPIIVTLIMEKLNSSQTWVLTRAASFHGSDYEQCHPLGYKNSVCTSQETHVSATGPSQLMLRKI
jgi:hypothetical protein